MPIPQSPPTVLFTPFHRIQIPIIHRIPLQLPTIRRIQSPTSRVSYFSARMASTNPQFSSGADKSAMAEEVSALLDAEWKLSDDRIGIEKTYYFKTYTKVLDFAQTIGIRSKAKNHHSEMLLKSGSVHIHWTTHNPHGLSEKDTFMAKYCDEQARTIGTVEKDGQKKCRPTATKG